MRIPWWETPVPIPNTAVKPPRADGSEGVAPCESRLSPGFRNLERKAYSFPLFSSISFFRCGEKQ